MTGRSAFSFMALFFLLTGCSVAQTQSPAKTLETPPPGLTAPQQPKQTLTSPPTATALALTPSSTPTITPTPTRTLTSTPSPTPDATSLARATLDALGDPCQPNGTVERYGSGVSPDGKWVAISCYGGPVSLGRDSFLLVFSLDGGKQWSLYFRDFANGGSYDAKDGLNAYRWSPDGKYLYAIAGSRLSGCCWIGNLVLLVRLNLETGAQIAFLNGMSEYDRNPLNFAISEDGRYLFLSPQNRSLDITTLSTGETQRVELQFQRAIDANFILISPEGDQIILGLFHFQEDEEEFVLETIGFINLITGKQSVIPLDMVKTGSLYPIEWEDGDLVLFSNYPDRPDLADFWLLNIYTGEVVQVENL